MTRIASLARTPFIGASDPVPSSGITVGSTYGTYASRPAAGHAGALFTCSDSPVGLWVDSGSAWKPQVSGHFQTKQAPLANTFTQFGATDGSVVNDNGTLLVSANTGTSDDFFTNSAALAGAAWSLKTCVALEVRPVDPAATYEPVAAVVIRDSGTGQLYRVGMYFTGGLYYPQVQKFTDVTAGTQIAAMTGGRTPLLWTQVTLSGGNLTFYISQDGTIFRQFAQEAVGTWGTPDQWGVWSGKTNNAIVSKYHVLSSELA
jgi:hypothetical protein